jgi:1-acyl-sn-glycerol-3-phosphate acyltransferase
MRWFVAPVTHLLAHSYGYGLDRVPASGGAVIAANHLSGIDHPLLGLFCRRAVYFMAKAELFRVPVFGTALPWTGAFPVRRGERDHEALLTARRRVREGHVVGIHVEGTRQRSGRPGLVKRGAAIVALEERVPVVPCGLATFGWALGNRKPCAVVWGEPLSLDYCPATQAGIGEATRRICDELNRLWQQAVAAVDAGFPPTLPDGTPRAGPVRPSDHRGP